MELAERKKRILSAIIECYIATGEPVGSKNLAESMDMGLSSATIRNEMSELVEMGLLEQPHTSAGRVPSQAGYRLYVDHLMSRRCLTPEEVAEINRLLEIRESDLESILEEAGKILAEVTGFAALSTSPRSAGMALRRIELVPVGRKSALLILVTNTGVVRSRLCHLKDCITSDMISFFSRIANDRLCEKPVEEITDETVAGIAGELYEYTFTLRPVLDVIRGEATELLKSEVFLGGEENLLSRPGIDSERLKKVLHILEKRDELAKLVEGIKGGVQVCIGTESGLQFMSDSSVVAAPYAFGGSPAGMVGIIGPKRMDYARMVPSLEYFSRVLSRLINNAFGSM